MLPVATRYDALLQRPLIQLDGAMGTQLEHLLPTARLPWSLDGLVRHPELTSAVHEAYLEAGADVLTTNAFRANRRALARVCWDEVELPSTADEALKAVWRNRAWDDLEGVLAQLAVRLAQTARTRRGPARACVAGNLAPLEDCFSPELAPARAAAECEHRPKARALAEAGADLILIETMNSLREALGALAAALETGLPIWISFVCRGGPTLLSGEPLEAAARAVLDHQPGVDALLVNCCFPEEIDAIVPALGTWLAGSGVRFGAYANLEAPNANGVWQRRAELTPQAHAAWAARWVAQGVSIIGACCGSTPEDIAWLSGRGSTATGPVRTIGGKQKRKGVQ